MGTYQNSLRLTVLVSAVFGATLPGVAAIWLLAEAAIGHGGYPGNILRVGVGVFLFLISALVLGLTSIYLKSNKSRSDGRAGVSSHSPSTL
jgi:hypothetical protein